MMPFFFFFFRLLKEKKENVEDEVAWRIPTMFTLVIILCLFFAPLSCWPDRRMYSTKLGIGCTKKKKKEKEPLRYRFGHDMTWKRFMGLRFYIPGSTVADMCIFSLLRLVDFFLSMRNNFYVTHFSLALGLYLYN